MWRLNEVADKQTFATEHVNDGIRINTIVAIFALVVTFLQLLFDHSNTRTYEARRTMVILLITIVAGCGAWSLSTVKLTKIFPSVSEYRIALLNEFAIVADTFLCGTDVLFPLVELLNRAPPDDPPDVTPPP